MPFSLTVIYRILSRTVWLSLLVGLCLVSVTCQSGNSASNFANQKAKLNESHKEPSTTENNATHAGTKAGTVSPRLADCQAHCAHELAIYRKAQTESLSASTTNAFVESCKLACDKEMAEKLPNLNLKGQGVESHEVVEGAETRSYLVGLWETAKQSTGGLGSYMEFRSDGTLVSGMGAMVDFNYKIKGKEFVIISGARNAEKQTKIDINISGDIMTNKGPDGKELRKKRMTKKVPGGSDIVGVWKYEHYTGGPAYELYTEDGRMLLRIPFPGASIGEYEVSGNTLKMSYKGQGTEIIDFKIEGNTLSLSKEKGSHSSFVKSQHGVWYRPVTTSE